MKIPKNSLVLAAAVTGLLGGTINRLNAAPTSDHSLKISAAGAFAGAVANDKKEKHACKGQNSCKGKGGCKSSDNGCKGKNSCKGKGGCATN